MPRGDVNLDLFIGHSPHFFSSKKRIKPERIRNFVRGDANNLPFNNKVFDECSCHHVLEHNGINPFKVLKEMLRVTKAGGIITIAVPHRIADRKRASKKWGMHKRDFNLKNLVAFLHNFSVAYEVKVKFRCYPYSYLCLIRLPQELIVNIRGID